jgi:hypothetical protein
VLQLYRAAHLLWRNHSHVLALALQAYISEVFQTIFSLSLSSLVSSPKHCPTCSQASGDVKGSQKD